MLKGEPEKEIEVEQVLFQDEVSYQTVSFQIYAGIVLFNFLLVAAFLILGAGILFSLTAGFSIGVSCSMLFLSTLRIGSKTFTLNFIWFMAVLLGFAYFGMPEALTRSLEKIGITSEIMVLICMIQAVLFFVYVSYRQWQDFNRKAIELDGNDIKIDSKLVSKKVKAKEKTKKKKEKKELLKKKFSFNRSKLKEAPIDEELEEQYEYYRKAAVYLLIGISLSIVITMTFFLGASALPGFLFVAMFLLTGFLILLPMIKPGTQRFWMCVIVIFIVIALGIYTTNFAS